MGSINWNQYIKEAEAAGESLDEFTPVPADTYEVKAFKVDATKTNDGKKDMLKVTWVIEGGPHAGRRVWSNLTASPESPKAMAILIRQLSTLGVRPLLESGASFEQIAGALTGVLATITVTVGEWNAKPKNDVKSIAARKASDPGEAAVRLPTNPGLPV